MSFTVNLMQNKSPSNFVTKDVESVLSVTGNLREETSIIDPILTIETTISANVIGKINYAYIQEFNRYYYVVNITSIANDLWEIEFHVDVLMSYAVKIREQTAVVARQENRRNMYLDDGWFMAYQDPIIQMKYFSVPSPFETQEYVLLIAGS